MVEKQEKIKPERICGCCTVRFKNPDAETIKRIQEIVQRRD